MSRSSIVLIVLLLVIVAAAIGLANMDTSVAPIRVEQAVTANAAGE